MHRDFLNFICISKIFNVKSGNQQDLFYIIASQRVIYNFVCAMSELTLVSFHLFLKYVILIIEMKHICLSSLQLNTKYISRYQKDTTAVTSSILSIRINAVHRTGILSCFQFLKSAQQRRSTAKEATEILLLGKYYYLLSKYFNQLLV